MPMHAGSVSRCLRKIAEGCCHKNVGLATARDQIMGDIDQNGMDLARNIKQMFRRGDGHVLVLAASIRSLEHLLYCFALETELATVPAKVLELRANRNFPMPDKQFQYKDSGKSIPYEDLDLERPWEIFEIQHELTRKGIEKFAADCRATLS